MKALRLPALLLVILCWLAVPQRAEAATGLSQITYNPDNNLVQGYSRTELTYDEAYYYDAAVEGYLYQGGSLAHYNLSQGDQWASVNTEAFGVPDVRYALYSDHYVGAFFFECSTVTVYDECGTVSYYDPFGFSNYPSPAYYGGFNYFYAYPVCYAYYSYIYLGTTDVALIVPQPSQASFAVDITSPRASGVLDNTTQNALLGANLTLQAQVTPSHLANGSYSWNISGPHQIAGGSTNSNSVQVRWTQTGNYSAKIDYTLSGVRRSETVNINVVVPTLVSFTGTIHHTPEVGDCLSVPGVVTAKPFFMLGCLQGNLRGVRFDATVRSPQYISDDGFLKYVQVVNGGHTRYPVGGGTAECLKTDGRWYIDDNPYALEDSVTQQLSTSQEGETTLRTYDTPGIRLDDGYNVETDQQFEMYLVYFANGVEVAYGYLPWSWGGEVIEDRSAPLSFRKITGFPSSVPQPLTFVSASAVRPYVNIEFIRLTWTVCSSPNPDPPPDPDPDPCYSGSGWNCQ